MLSAYAPWSPRVIRVAPVITTHLERVPPLLAHGCPSVWFGASNRAWQRISEPTHTCRHTLVLAVYIDESGELIPDPSPVHCASDHIDLQSNAIATRL